MGFRTESYVTVTFLVAAVLAMQSPAGDTSNAYLDAEARRLVAAARTRRETIDRSITAYQVTMRERIGVGIRALRRDRTLYRREITVKIDWSRDSLTQITVVGARQTIPVAIPKPPLPEDLKSDAPDYAFDPANDRVTGGGARGAATRLARPTPNPRVPKNWRGATPGLPCPPGKDGLWGGCRTGNGGNLGE